MADIEEVRRRSLAKIGRPRAEIEREVRERHFQPKIQADTSAPDKPPVEPPVKKQPQSSQKLAANKPQKTDRDNNTDTENNFSTKRRKPMAHAWEIFDE